LPVIRHVAPFGGQKAQSYEKATKESFSA